MITFTYRDVLLDFQICNQCSLFKLTFLHTFFTTANFLRQKKFQYFEELLKNEPDFCIGNSVVLLSSLLKVIESMPYISNLLLNRFLLEGSVPEKSLLTLLELILKLEYEDHFYTVLFSRLSFSG